MSEDHKKPGAAFFLTAVFFSVAVLLCSYSGAYYLLVHEGCGNTFGPGAPPPYAMYVDYNPMLARTHREAMLARFFGPAHWADRNFIRPAKWAK